MADYPDVYADGFMIAAGPMSVTITWTLTDPGTKPGAQGQIPVRPVARIRLSPPLTEDLLQVLSKLVADAKAGTSQQIGSQTKH